MPEPTPPPQHSSPDNRQVSLADKPREIQTENTKHKNRRYNDDVLGKPKVYRPGPLLPPQNLHPVDKLEPWKIDPYNADHAAVHDQASGSLLGALRRHHLVNDFIVRPAEWYTNQSCDDLLTYFGKQNKQT